jgi:hypothetical protein
MDADWKRIVQDNRLDQLKRLAAYQLVIGHLISYPSTFASFATDALSPFGIAKDQLVDMTMGQYVPVQRQGGNIVQMARLPFVTSVGNASLYFSQRRADDVVEEAAVYPGVEEMR